MKNKKILQKFIALLLITLSFSFGALQADGKKIKVGFVYVGPVGDLGWTYRHDEGRKEVEAELGAQVETTFVESVPEGADSERVITKLARNGHDLIFTTSFGYMNPTNKVAKKFPKVKFEHATGFKRAKNVSSYNARFYEGRYPVGLIAGKMTKSNILGYVASVPIPEVIRGINAVAIAARKVNPKVEVRVIWVNSWYDPGKEADAAKTLINQGADVILQHTDSAAAQQVAEEKGVWSVGQASDMSKFAPKAHLTAIIDNWGPYYVDRVKAVINGTWKEMDSWKGLKEEWVQLSPYNKAIPADVKKLSEDAIADIKSGKLYPFQGPIKNQKGKVIIKKGESLSDGDLLKMNYYVEGVIGDVPN